MPTPRPDPDIAAIDAVFVILIALAILACFVLLWFDISQQAIAECIQRWSYRP